MRYRKGVAAALERFQIKTAAVFGAAPPPHLGMVEIPYENRHEAFRKYLEEKAGEKPTGYGRAMLTGGLTGGLLAGGTTGAATGSLAGAGLGVAGGSLLGALLGAGVASADRAQIRESRDLLKDPRMLRDALDERIYLNSLGSVNWEREEAERRHQEMLKALQPRPSPPISDEGDTYSTSTYTY